MGWFPAVRPQPGAAVSQGPGSAALAAGGTGSASQPCYKAGMARKQASRGRKPGPTRKGTPAKRHPTGAARPPHQQKEDTAGTDPSAPFEAPPFLVAAVGASAGGLEAFTTLLRNVPRSSPLTLILAQHLARGHASILPDLLRSHTQLEVVGARDNLRIEPRHVYVIPPDTEMTVADGLLRVRPREAANRNRSGVVDTLFRSVAECYRDRAIGVVLSGSAADGTAGLREIKAAGGITIAQLPEEAQIDGMPRAAVASGAVDLVLRAGEIASELVRLARHPFFSRESTVPDESLSDEAQMRRIFQQMRRAMGVDFSHYKTPTILRRIQRRMALHRLASLGEYVEFLHRDAGEPEKLQEDLLIHVTSFFRGAESFEALKERVFPQIIKEQQGETPLRIWVAGCSTGEEAYSLAIALLEVLGDRADSVPIHVFGTDLSEKTIETARAAIYPASIASDVSPDRLRRFFTAVDGGYRLNKAVRDRCVFARQDVTRDPPYSKLDLIVCRNLLIYLVQAAQRKVISVFHYALKPNGYLMLGRSESLGASADLFRPIDKRDQIHLKKSGMVRPELQFAPAEADPAAPREVQRAGVRRREEREWDVQEEANRILLGRYSPPSVIVDNDLRIVRTRGRTSPFLELPSGEASLDILKMAKSELLFALRAVIQEARTRNAPATRENARVGSAGHGSVVNIHVTPLGAPETRHFLVLFEETRAQVAEKRSPRSRKKAGHDESVARLQQELAETRQQLQSIIDDFAAANEELQSANDEILSSNEELQSTNEELDTAKEELQSTNEELSTLNDELHARNEELSRLNSDLVNLLASVHIPIVMVTTDLRIRRFTPAAEKALNLIASDLGRPIGHIKPTFICPDLERLITEAIDNVTIREQEVQDQEGQRFMLQIRPYKNVESRIDGAVLTLLDLAPRDVETALRTAREMGEAIISTVREPMLLLGGNLDVQRANRAFCEKFHVSAADTEGRRVYQLGSGQWNIPALRKLLEEVLPEQKNFEGFYVEHDFPELGHRRMLLDGRRIDTGPGGMGLVVLVIRDVTTSPA